MPTLIFKVEWADQKGFQTLAEGVKLTFSNDVGTFPMPKDKALEEALKEQCPKVFAKIPTFRNAQGFIWRRGIAFTVTKRL